MTMNQAETAATLRRFAEFFKGLVDAADTLDVLQRAEETVKAAEARVDTANATLIGVQSDIEIAQAQLVDIRAKASKAVKDANAKIDKFMADAEEQATRIKASAISAAEERAAAATVDIEARMAQASERIESMGAQLSDMADRKATLQADIDTRTAELTELEGKVAAARATIASMLGTTTG